MEHGNLNYSETDNSDFGAVRRSYSWDELYKLRCFVEAQRLMVVQRHEEATSQAENLCLAFTANTLCDIMDEITALLDDSNCA